MLKGFFFTCLDTQLAIWPKTLIITIIQVINVHSFQASHKLKNCIQQKGFPASAVENICLHLI